MMNGGFIFFGLLFTYTALTERLLYTFLTSLVFISFPAVLTCFVFHETAHKVTAIRYGAKAYFKCFYWSIPITIISSLFMIIFAAPGGVVIQDWAGKPLNRREQGITAMNGPLTNMIIAGVMLPFVFMELNTVYAIYVFAIGYINAFVGFFNTSIPYGPFDGAIVFRYNKKLWLVLFLVSFLLLIEYIILQPYCNPIII